MVDYLIKMQAGNGTTEEILVERTEEPTKAYNCYMQLYTEKHSN